MTLRVILLSTLIPTVFIVGFTVFLIVIYYNKKKDWKQQLQKHPTFSNEDVTDNKISIKYGNKNDKSCDDIFHIKLPFNFLDSYICASR